jgi:hypothetical protein
MIAADGQSLLMVAQFVESMLGDGIISGVTQSQAAGLIRLPLTFDGAAELVYKLAGKPDLRTDGIFWKMFPSAVLIRIIIWGILFGAGFGEFVECPKTGLPVLHFVEAQHINWRRDPVTRQQVLFIIGEDGEHIIEPGNGRWFVFAPWGLNRFWLHGKWRPCGKAWLDKIQAQEQRTVAGARHALGITWLETPEGKSRDEDANAIVAHIISSPTPPVMALEKGYDIKHTSISGEGYQQWTATKNESDADIATALSGQTVTSGQTGTGWSKGDIHENTAQSFIEEYADHLSEVVQRYGLEPWAEREGYPCPRAEWDPTPPRDRKAVGDALIAYGDGLVKADASLVKRGKRVKAEPLAALAGIEIEDLEPLEDPTVIVDGLPVVVEYPAGSVRTGTDERGVPWAVSMGSIAYGYIPGTQGEDGEAIDVFVGPMRGTNRLFVLKQLDHEGNPDEVKLFVGFGDMQSAREAWYRLVGRPELVGGWREVDLATIVGILHAAPRKTIADGADETTSLPDGEQASARADMMALPPAAQDEGEASPDDMPADADAVELARLMTEHSVDRCNDHNRVNRCWQCGIERVRRMVPGKRGQPHKWPITWRAIGQKSPGSVIVPSQTQENAHV